MFRFIRSLRSALSLALAIQRAVLEYKMLRAKDASEILHAIASEIEIEGWEVEAVILLRRIARAVQQWED